MGMRLFTKSLSIAAFAVAFAVSQFGTAKDAHADMFTSLDSMVDKGTVEMTFEVYDDGGTGVTGSLGSIFINTVDTIVLDSSTSPATTLSGDFVVFTFEMTTGILSEVWFEEDFASIFDGPNSWVYQTSGVDFVGGIDESITPPAPPGSTNLPGDPGWLGAYAGFEVAMNTADGVDPNTTELLQIVFELEGEDAALSALDIMALIVPGNTLEAGGETGFNIAGFVRECTPTGGSCHVVANPLPGAVWLLGSALVGLLGFSAKRRWNSA